MPSFGWPSLAAELFPSTTRRSMCLTLIVGERPWRLRSWGGMFLPLVHQGPSSLRRIRPGLPIGRCRRRTWTCRLKAVGDGRTNALTGLLIMQAYALLAAVRGAFGAGVSRA